MIQLQGVSKHFEAFQLKDISITVEAGYIYGFVGQNGAGKTTTIKIMMGLLSPSEGEVSYFNKQSAMEAKQDIGFVYEDCGFYEHLTMEKMSKIIANFYDKWSWEKYGNYIRQFGLNTDRKISDLSKGMKIKFSLACALAHDPKLLVLDEPTSGLDPMFRAELLEIFQTYIEDGSKSVFFSTHITSDLEKVADYVYFINQGRIQLEATSDSLKEQFGLVKGPRVSIDKIQDYAIGTTHSTYQSQCVVANKGAINHLVDASCVIENASFEDILIHHIKEGAHEKFTL